MDTWIAHKSVGLSYAPKVTALVPEMRGFQELHRFGKT